MRTIIPLCGLVLLSAAGCNTTEQQMFSDTIATAMPLVMNGGNNSNPYSPIVSPTILAPPPVFDPGYADDPGFPTYAGGSSNYCANDGNACSAQ